MIYLSHYRYAATTETTVVDDVPYPQTVHWFPDTYAKAKAGIHYVAHVLANKVLDPALMEYVRATPAKTGFILAAGSQGWAGIRGKGDNAEDRRLYYRLKMPLLTLTNIYGGRVASMFGVEDYVATDACACASSTKALMDVQTLMRFYGFDRVVVLGLEDAVNNSTIEFFGHAKASLQLDDDRAGRLPSAFDSTNTGFHIGQGVGLAIFESERVIKAEPAARLLGAYTASENFDNPLGQRPDGQGYVNAIRGALQMAELQPNDVKIIKTHGTGTLTNNAAERAAIETVFTDFVATSYKPKYGHTLAASGLMETGLLLDDIKKGIIPAIPNRTEKDDRFLSYDVPTSGGAFLSLAAGMGGVFSAAVLTTEV